MLNLLATEVNLSLLKIRINDAKREGKILGIAPVETHVCPNSFAMYKSL